MSLAIDIREIQGGLIRASCTILPGCVGYGTSLEEACRDMKDAVRDYFANGRRVRMDYFGNGHFATRN